MYFIEAAHYFFLCDFIKKNKSHDDGHIKKIMMFIIQIRECDAMNNRGFVCLASRRIPIQGGPKHCISTVSQQILQQCAPIKLVLSDLSMTHVVSHKYDILRNMVKTATNQNGEIQNGDKKWL